MANVGKQIMRDESPKLVALAGPLKGKTFLLSEAEFSVGRENSNSLSIKGKLISRRHALIRRVEPGQFSIIDLNSRNGTSVNAVPVKERKLMPGDRIQIGDSLLLFLPAGDGLRADDISADSVPVRFDDENLVTSSAVQLPLENSVYLNFKSVPGKSPVNERTVSDLRTLLKICTEINAPCGLNALQQRLLGAIFEAVPADSGAILLSAGSDDEPVASFSWSRAAGANSPVVVSRSVIREVVRTRSALLSNDISKGDTISLNQSLIRRNVQSFLAVPLLLLDKVTGVIYLETREWEAQFDEAHLQLMMGIAGIASIAIEIGRASCRE